MNWKTWVPLALAIVLGLIAMKVAKDVLAQRDTGTAPTQRMVEVVVMKRNVPPGAALRPDDLMVGQMSGEVPPESTFRSVAELEGRVVTTALRTGQPVLDSLLAPKGTGSGLQALVPKGMRAITLEINEFSGLAGFLVPNCHVDVVSTISSDDGDMISRTVVQNVKVTAIGQRKQQEGNADQGEPTRSVTLLVNPKQAEAIELAAATGRPRLVLRSSGDDSTNPSPGITVAELRGGRRKAEDPFAVPVELLRPTPATQPVEQVTAISDPQPVAPLPRLRTIKVIRGGVESHNVLELAPETGEKLMTDANQ